MTTRWYLYEFLFGPYVGKTLLTDEEGPDTDGIRCVAAGTEQACDAAARLMKVETAT